MSAKIAQTKITEREIEEKIKDYLQGACLVDGCAIFDSDGALVRKLFPKTRTRAARVLGIMVSEGRVYRAREHPQYKGHDDRPVTFWLEDYLTPEHVAAYRNRDKRQLGAASSSSPQGIAKLLAWWRKIFAGLSHKS